MQDIYNLLQNDIPDGRQSLDDNHSNLERVASYCEGNYLQATDKRHALEETKNYTTQSLASVAYQISTLASNFITLLDLQFNQVAEMESSVNHLAQTVAIHKEKVARREIGVLTTNKTTPRLQGVKNPGIIFPTEPERPVKYMRKPVDYTVLDDIGHGVKVQQREPAQRHPSNVSRRSTAQQGPAQTPATATPPTPPPDYRSSRGMTGTLSRQTSAQSQYSQGMQGDRTSAVSQRSHYRTTQGLTQGLPQHVAPGVQRQSSSPYRTPVTQPPVNPPTLPSNYAHSHIAQQQMEAAQAQQRNSNYAAMRMNTAPPAPPGQAPPPPVGTATPISRNPSVRSNVSAAPPPQQQQQQQARDSYGELPPPPAMYGGAHDVVPASPPLPPPPEEQQQDMTAFTPQPGGVNYGYGLQGPGQLSRGYSHDAGYDQHQHVQPDWVPAEYLEKVVAIYDYSKDKEDELTFSEGSVIYVVKKNDDGWWEGTMDGQTGLFPGNYVEPCI